MALSRSPGFQGPNGKSQLLSRQRQKPFIPARFACRSARALEELPPEHTVVDRRESLRTARDGPAVVFHVLQKPWRRPGAPRAPNLTALRLC